MPRPSQKAAESAPARLDVVELYDSREGALFGFGAALLAEALAGLVVYYCLLLLR